MRINIKTKMIAILILIIVIPIATLGVLSYSKAKNVLLTDLNSHNEKIITHVNDYFLKDFMDNIEKNIKIWSAESNLRNGNIDPIAIKAMMNDWTKVLKANSDLLWIYIGTENGEFYIKPKVTLPMGHDARLRPWYKQAMENPGEVIWTDPYVDELTHQLTITAASTIRDYTSDNKPLGVIGIDFSIDRFSKMIDNTNLDNSGYTIIINSRGRILTHPNEKMLGKVISNNPWINTVLKTKEGSTVQKLDGREYYLSYTTIAKTGWKFISLIPTSSMLNVVIPIRNRTITVAIISILVALFAGIMMSNYVANKIRNVIKYMNEVENGNLDVQSYYNGNDEFGDLNRQFNSMAQKLSMMMKESKLLSITDGLTKLYNHKYIYERLDEEIVRAKRLDSKLSIIMIDVDNFKEINDLYGHLAGDKSLYIIGSIIKSSLREMDIVGRYGGEEFLVILPGIGEKDCFIAAERIRKNVECLVWEYGERDLTVSLGIKQFEDENALELVEKADMNLYKAKNNGKNRVER